MSILNIKTYQIPKTRRDGLLVSTTNVQTISGGGSGGDIDTSNFLLLSGASDTQVINDTDILIKRNLYVNGNIVAYSTLSADTSTIFDQIPYATTTSKGLIIVGENLTIENGVLSATGGGSGVSSWNDLLDRPEWLRYTTLSEFQTGHAHDQYQLATSAWNTSNFNPTTKQDALNGTGFVKINGTTITYDNTAYQASSTAWNTSNFNPSTKQDASTAWNTNNFNPSSKQNALNGTGFVKINGTTISYDNTSYQASSTAWNTSNFNPATKQDASSAINTSNIGSQQVSSARYLYHIDGSRNPNDVYPNWSARTLRADFIGAGNVGMGGNYAGMLTFVPWDGTSSSTGDASYQLMFGSTASNGGGVPQLKIRKGIDYSWGGLYDIWTSANLNRSDTDFSAKNITGSGSLTMSGNITAYSDIRLKTNIQKVDNVLSKLDNINAYTYYRKDLNDNKRHLGLIAQEVGCPFPELVQMDKDEIQSLNYQNLVAVSIQGIKELKKENEELKKEIYTLRQQVYMLSQKIMKNEC